MSRIAQRLNPVANADLLIEQWRNAPRMRRLVEAILGVVEAHLVKPLQQLETMGTIDGAEGYWLDLIGERLGMPRPAVQATDYDLFGFENGDGVGFDQAAFATVNPALSPRVPVGDESYRPLLRMRSLALVADGSVPAMEGVVAHVGENGRYRDNADMSIVLHTPIMDAQVRDLIGSVDAWPRPAGVSMTLEIPVLPRPTELVRATVTVGNSAPGELFDGRAGSPVGSAEGDLHISTLVRIHRIRWLVSERLVFNNDLGDSFQDWAQADGSDQSFFMETENRIVELKVADAESGSAFIRWDVSTLTDLKSDLVEGAVFTLVVGESTDA